MKFYEVLITISLDGVFCLLSAARSPEAALLQQLRQSPADDPHAVHQPLPGPHHHLHHLHQRHHHVLGALQSTPRKGARKSRKNGAAACRVFFFFFDHYVANSTSVARAVYRFIAIFPKDKPLGKKVLNYINLLCLLTINVIIYLAFSPVLAASVPPSETENQPCQLLQLPKKVCKRESAELHWIKVFDLHRRCKHNQTRRYGQKVARLNSEWSGGLSIWG